MRLIGFNQTGGKVTGNIENLEITSVQNKSTTTGSSSGINVGVSSTGTPNSISVSGSKTNGNRTYVDNQSTFILGEGSNLTVGKATNTGAIVGTKGENSRLKIKEYTGKDLYNTDTLKTTGGSIGLQTGKNPVTGAGFNQERHDKEGITRNTVIGNVEIGKSKGSPINTDLSKANETTRDTHRNTNIYVEGQTIRAVTNPEDYKKDIDKAKQEITDIGRTIKEAVNDRGDDNRNFFGKLSETRLSETLENIAGERLKGAKDQQEIGKALEDAYRDLGYKAKVIYTDPKNAPQLIGKDGKVLAGTAYVGKDGIHTILVNTEADENGTRSGIIGTIAEEGSHIVGKVEGRQRKTGTEELGLESTGRATNQYFQDKYKDNDIPIKAKSDGKDYSSRDFGEHVGDDRGACRKNGQTLLNCNPNTPAIKPTMAGFRGMDDRGSKTYESSKNAIKNLNDYCAKHSNVCRATKKGEYEFYDTKKLSEYEKYLKQSGLKDEIRLVNREKEYKHAQESKKYKEDRSKANREEIKAGEMLAKFNYLQMYQAYISQGGEKNKEAFEKSEGYTFNENKLISDIKNAGINFGGRYKIYDGNTYITSVRTYEDLVKFVGVISKNEIKMATSDIFTQASFRERDKEPVIIDFKGAVWSSQVGEAVTSSMIAKEALSKQPIYEKPIEEAPATEKTSKPDFQNNNQNNENYNNSNSKQLEYSESVIKKSNDTYHKTPAIFDLEMIKEKPALIRNDGRVEYLRKGYINGQEGIYHITVRNGNRIIHKNFIPKNRWADYMQDKSLPSYDVIK